MRTSDPDHRIHLSVALGALMILGCSGSPAPSEPNEAVTTKIDSVAAAIPALDVKQYAIFHNQNFSISHFADMGQGLYPVVGNVFDPGGPGRRIAEAGKRLVIRYDRYRDTYSTSTPPAPGPYVVVVNCSDCASATVYDTFKHVSLHYRIDGGAIQTLDVPLAPSDAPQAAIDIPASAKGALDYWFEIRYPDDHVEWDSAFGANYHVEILSAPTAALTFDSAWSHTVSGTLKAGDTMRIAYDRERLKNAVWGNTPFSPNELRINAFVSFDGAAAASWPIDQDYGSLLQPIIRIPAGARSMQLWFKGEGNVTVESRPGDSSTLHQEYHVAFDSNFGANYSFAIAQ